VTHLRKKMLDELQALNYAQNTIRHYVRTVEDFARRFNCSPDRLGPRHVREYQAELFRKGKSPGTVTHVWQHCVFSTSRRYGEPGVLPILPTIALLFCDPSAFPGARATTFQPAALSMESISFFRVNHSEFDGWARVRVFIFRIGSRSEDLALY
jgi:hypothetical protein